MAIIYSYPVITSLANDDRLIISDMDSTTGNPTKSVTLSTLKSFISGTPGAGGVSGTGTTNQIPLWTNGPGGVIGDSLLKQDVGGTEVQLGGNLSMKANDLLDVNGNTGTAGQLLSSLGTGNGVDWITVAPAIPHIINDPQAIGSLFIGYNTFSGVPSFALGNLAVGVGPLQNITTGDFNIALGGLAGAALTTGGRNILVGQNAGIALTNTDDNIAIGYSALKSQAAGDGASSGEANIAIGTFALENMNAAGAPNVSMDNIAVGYDAGKGITTGRRHVFIGKSAGAALTTSQESVAIGFNALKSDAVVGGTVAIGARALENQGNGTSSGGGGNTAVGFTAGSSITEGSYNTLIGNKAGDSIIGSFALSQGQYNTFVGYFAGDDVTTGSQNTIIGANSDTLTTGNNNTLLGYNAEPTAISVSNEFTLGDSSVAVLRCQQTTITALSDQRDKTSVEDLPYGLDFVDSLQPKKFIWDNRAETRIEKDENGNQVEVEYFSANKGKKDIGFIAQELQTVDDEWLNLVYDSNPERLEASYGKLIPVLVKAIKELKAKVEALEA